MRPRSGARAPAPWASPNRAQQRRAQPIAPRHQRSGDLALEPLGIARACWLVGSTRTTMCSCASGASPIDQAAIRAPCPWQRRAQQRLDARLRGGVAALARHDTPGTTRSAGTHRGAGSVARARAPAAPAPRARSGSDPARWPGTVHRAAASAGSATGACRRGCWRRTESARCTRLSFRRSHGTWRGSAAIGAARSTGRECAPRRSRGRARRSA